MSVELGPPGQQELGRVLLCLVESEKSVEQAPARISFGLIRLRGWQLDRLEPVSAGFPGHAAYLVRVSYEFDMAPDAPTPAWAEVGFKFPDPEVVVLDALPIRVARHASATSYELTAQLKFARRNGGQGSAWPARSPAANIPLPELAPEIHSFGVDSSLIKWRHTGKVPAGSHLGWFVLRVPEAWSELPVVATGSFPVETDPILRLSPASVEDAFAVLLPPAVPAEPSGGAVTAASSSSGGRRVFVSYAQESAAHKAAVAEFCRFLGDKGVDVRFDQQDLHKRRNWDEWTNTQIRRADYVLVIASPEYLAAGDGELDDDTARRGVVSEYRRLADLLFRYRNDWTTKILPVVLPGRSPDEIPLTFLPGTADYYKVGSITDDGAADLLDVLLHP